MTGAYEISIKFRKVKYLLSIKHNITVVTGESATGKTALVSAVRGHSLWGASSGVILDSEVECRVLEGDIKNMRISVDNYPGCIFFVDEEYADVITTSEFASMVNTADAYFVIVTREDPNCLPYDIGAIKELKNNKGKYNNVGSLLAINELSDITAVSAAVVI